MTHRATGPLSHEEGLVIFILNEEIHYKLESWECSKQEDFTNMVVPYIEAGYPGTIQLLLVDELIFVTMEEKELSEFSKKLKKLEDLKS